MTELLLLRTGEGGRFIREEQAHFGRAVFCAWKSSHVSGSVASCLAVLCRAAGSAKVAEFRMVGIPRKSVRVAELLLDDGCTPDLAYR